MFLGLVVLGFSLWKKKYGLAALVGGMSHLLLDLNYLVPWFYPFKEYAIYKEAFNLIMWIKSYFVFSQIGYELVIVILMGLVVSFFYWLIRRLYRWSKS